GMALTAIRSDLARVRVLGSVAARARRRQLRREIAHVTAFARQRLMLALERKAGLRGMVEFHAPRRGGMTAAAFRTVTPLVHVLCPVAPGAIGGRTRELRVLVAACAGHVRVGAAQR